jgi:hypothetical protein
MQNDSWAEVGYNTLKTHRTSSKMQYTNPQSTLKDLKYSNPCEVHNFCSMLVITKILKLLGSGPL